jgi:hypothetical protein
MNDYMVYQRKLHEFVSVKERFSFLLSFDTSVDVFMIANNAKRKQNSAKVHLFQLSRVNVGEGKKLNISR